MTAVHITPEIRAALGVARAALEGRDSAYGPADTIVGALNDAGLLMSPDTAAELHRLRGEHTALAESITWHAQTCPAGQHRAWFAETAAPLPCPWCQLAELEEQLTQAGDHGAQAFQRAAANGAAAIALREQLAAHTQDGDR